LSFCCISGKIQDKIRGERNVNDSGENDEVVAQLEDLKIVHPEPSTE